jgi:hypothetical protein
MPQLSQWQLKNADDVPVQENSYDCGVFVCLFATCMALDCNMDFDQSDAPLMRMKLAHLIFNHRLNTQQSMEPDVSNTAEKSTTQTPVITQELPQSQSQQHSEQDSSASSTATSSGYLTIMKGPKRTKRKFFNSDKKDQSKKRKYNSKHASSSNPQGRQQTLTTMFTPQVQRNKRKMSITDEEHPFKHKRFKEDDKE